jgi:hypothetical protein
MIVRREPYSTLAVRRAARRLWADPAMQRKWLRAWLVARKGGGLLLEGSPAKWRAS